MTLLEDLEDKWFGLSGTPRRDEFDASVERQHRKWQRLNRAFGWLQSIPVVGPVAFCFWYALADEGPHGALDMLSFHFANDRYVPGLREGLARMRRKARRGSAWPGKAGLGGDWHGEAR